MQNEERLVLKDKSDGGGPLMYVSPDGVWTSVRESAPGFSHDTIEIEDGPVWYSERAARAIADVRGLPLELV